MKLPPVSSSPTPGVTAILLFTEANSGGTDDVWFYDVHADGFSLDDKRNPIEANDIPDVLARWWKQRNWAERDRARTESRSASPKRDRRAGLRPIAEPLQGTCPTTTWSIAAAGDHRRHRKKLEGEIAAGLAG